jgi:Tfp pilus assembly ATPase PilU
MAYFWIEKHDNGDIRLKVMTQEECEDLVNERVRNKEIPVYITHHLPKYLNDLKEKRVMIIKGDTIHPKPVTEVTYYEVH